MSGCEMTFSGVQGIWSIWIGWASGLRRPFNVHSSNQPYLRGVESVEHRRGER